MSLVLSEAGAKLKLADKALRKRLQGSKLFWRQGRKTRLAEGRCQIGDRSFGPGVRRERAFDRFTDALSDEAASLNGWAAKKGEE